MIWLKILKQDKLIIYIKKEYENEIKEGSKIWELVKIVGDRFPLFYNEKKFHRIQNVKCTLYEFKPDSQTRYFARLEGNKMIIYHKEIKKKKSLKTKEYNLICDAFNFCEVENG